MTLLLALKIASGLLSTTYGYGESYCGDYNSKPVPCESGAVTSTGMMFEPDAPTAAIFAPRSLYFKPTWVRLRLKDGPCAWILVNDKGNDRFMGKRGFDLSPGALVALGVKANKKFKQEVFVCE